MKNLLEDMKWDIKLQDGFFPNFYKGTTAYLTQQITETKNSTANSSDRKDIDSRRSFW